MKFKWRKQTEIPELHYDTFVMDGEEQTYLTSDTIIMKLKDGYIFGNYLKYCDENDGFCSEEGYYIEDEHGFVAWSYIPEPDETSV